jgi:hypothetical protein
MEGVARRHQYRPRLMNTKPKKPSLTPEAERALAEAEARRRAAADADKKAVEVGGRDGPDPARYGDWEKGGIASDF